MFIYLSKKIAIPNGVALRTVAWNNDQGWIACGGEEGLLKVLKLEGGGVPEAGSNGTERTQKVTGTPSNLSMNQTLEGHNGAVVVSTWNYQHRKLTTSDDNGLIIVWVLYKGIWYEEMINNRNKSIVADMQWCRDGTKICIVYEDGAVIVGSVDGNRIWGKELKMTLAHVQWTPDGQRILFGTANGELHLYDGTGNFLTKVPNYCAEGAGIVKIAALNWYNGLKGYVEAKVPTLAICYENGKIQLMRDEMDQAPIIIDTNMRQIQMKWNNNGSLLAVTGVQQARNAQGEGKDISVVQFFDPWGQFLRSLKVPGKRITSLSWEHSGLRIALAVDSFIYFANIRPDYKWMFFGQDVLAYSYHRAEKAETSLTFWNTKTMEKYTKPISKLLLLTSSGENGLMVTKSEQGDADDQCVLTVVNAIGTAQEYKYIEFEPKFAVITKQHAVIASADVVMHWHFRLASTNRLTALDVLRKADARDRAFHIDDVTVVGSGSSMGSISDLKKKGPSQDPIVALAATDATLVVARQSGAILQYMLPAMTLDNRYAVPFRPQAISLNSDASRLAIVDSAGLLKLMQLEKKMVAGKRPATGVPVMAGPGGLVTTAPDAKKDTPAAGTILPFERKDVWDIRWADDDPDQFAVMEKTRMYVFRNLEPEEPISCAGYICAFDNLQIKAALLDDIMLQPDAPAKDLITTIETKPLRDTRNILAQVGLADGLQFVEDNPSPRLWRIIVETALEQLDFNIAQKALVKCMDYPGLQFIKRLQKLNDTAKQRAEIAAYFGHYDLAEKAYLEMDRKDLAIDLREKIGDWFRVVQLIKSGGGREDAVLEKAWNHIGDYYYDRQRWTQAATYYVQGRNFEKLAECYYLVEDFDNLEKLTHKVPESSPIIKNIAEKFVSVGLVEPATQAYLKAGDTKAAIDTCVFLNQWNTAIQLAHRYNYREIEVKLTEYAEKLLKEDKKVEVIELYRKANYCQKSANLLYELAVDASKKSAPPLVVKKMFVLAALEVERYHQLTRAERGGKEGTANALESLLAEDAKTTTDSKFLDNVWRGAEAYHYYMMAQRQFYAGNVDASVKTALYLREYDDIIDAKTIFSLLALVSLHAKRFVACSKAFIKLEALPGANEEELEKFQELAFEIFSKYPPHEPKAHHVACTNCGGIIRDSDTYCNHCHITFPTCVASGQPILESIHFMCHVCKHRAIESEIAGLANCPMCHAQL